MKHLSLSWKLFLLLSLFSLLPLVAWYGSIYFERQIENSTSTENQQLLKSYHGFFQKLLKEDKDFAQSLALEKLPNQVKISKRQGPILVDGFADEWFPYQSESLQARNDSSPSNLMLVEDERFLYGLFQIRDNQLVYRKNSFSSQSSDMVRLDLGQGFWLFQAVAPGRMNVLREYGDGFRTINSVFATWQETQHGYNIEFRAAKALIGDRVNAVLYDVDDKQSKSYNKNYQGIFTFTNFNYFPLSREKNTDWLLDHKLDFHRLSFINSNGQLIYQIGTLFPDIKDAWISVEQLQQEDSYRLATKLDNQFTRKVTTDDFAFEQTSRGTHHYIARSGMPFQLDDQLLGLIVLESSALENKAKLQLVRWLGLLVLLLIWFFISLTILKQARIYRQRVDRLNQLTELAYESDSDNFDVTSLEVEGSDEVAQLHNSLIYFSQRLEQRRDHQQKLLARLNHELRTPLAIIGSSIDNLALSDLDEDDQMLIRNARAGLERLSLSFSRLSEANRLEESIDSVALDWLDLNPLISSLVDSYAKTWPEQKFELKLPQKIIRIRGAQDLFAQMLDKVISNAVDFSEKGSAIKIQLEQVKSELVLSINNKGPTIEKNKLKDVFNLMESMRKKKSGETSANLGLGLYISKLIAKRHKARIQAKNRKTNDGVSIQLLWNKKNFVVL